MKALDGAHGEPSRVCAAAAADVAVVPQALVSMISGFGGRFQAWEGSAGMLPFTSIVVNHSAVTSLVRSLSALEPVWRKHAFKPYPWKASR